jgi:hypothetical protein
MGKWLRARLLHSSRRARAVRAAGAAAGEVEVGEGAFQPIASIPALSRFCLSSDLPAPAPPPAPLPAPTAVGGLFFYTDVSGHEQGPFESKLVFAWASAGMLQPSTPVRRQGDAAHSALASFAEFKGGAAAAVIAPTEQRSSAPVPSPAPVLLSADQMRLEAILSRLPGGADPVQAQSWPPPSRPEPAAPPPVCEPDYAARGAFNARTGRFVAPEDVGMEARGERLPWPEPNWEEREAQGKRRRAA